MTVNKFEPEERDRKGLERLYATAKHAGRPVDLACFSRAEAYWLREKLENRGIDVVRISWLDFSRPSGPPGKIDPGAPA